METPLDLDTLDDSSRVLAAVRRRREDEQRAAADVLALAVKYAAMSVRCASPRHDPLVRKKWPCPCCGHLTLREGPGDYDGCPVCYWEDDGTQLRWPLSDDGANGISLVAAQASYQRIGACHERFRDKVRPPRRDEPLDEGWRPVDPHVDRLEDHDAAVRRRWPADPTRLYY